MKDGQFKDDVLRLHNDCRKKHNASQVTWSNDLANQAQKWANQIARKGKFQHAPLKQRKGQGENIAMAKGKDLTGEAAVMMWYNEIDDYTFTPTPAYNPNCGHFTQVVWKETEQIGAGKANGKNGAVYIVCRYSPAGNMQSRFSDNINPPTLNDENMNKPSDTPIESEDAISPMIETDVCSAPDMDGTAETLEVNNQVDENQVQAVDPSDSTTEATSSQSLQQQQQPLSSTRKETKVRPTPIMEMFEFTFERKIITAEERDPEKPRLKTREVQQVSDPVRRPAYQSREQYYLKTGNSYHVTYSYYADEVIEE